MVARFVTKFVRTIWKEDRLMGHKMKQSEEKILSSSPLSSHSTLLPFNYLLI